MKTIEEIEKKYPELFSNCYCGNSCPQGWANILESVCSIMDWFRIGGGRYFDLNPELQDKHKKCSPLGCPTMKLTIAQVKEKFGGIRIYYDYEFLKSEDPLFLTFDYEKYLDVVRGYIDEIDGAIRMAEKMSYKTCQTTGAEGSLGVKNGWYATYSKELGEKHGYKTTKND